MAENVEMYSPGLKLLAADLRAVGDGIALEVRNEAQAAAQEIAKDAQGIALSYQSMSEPKAGSGSGGTREAVAESIHVVREGMTVRIEAGGAGVPLAGLWELGNKSGNPNDPTFRHPVFGKRSTAWQEQAKWPYLRRAMDSYEPVMMTRFQSVVNRLFQRHRL